MNTCKWKAILALDYFFHLDEQGLFTFHTSIPLHTHQAGQKTSLCFSTTPASKLGATRSLTLTTNRTSWDIHRYQQYTILSQLLCVPTRHVHLLSYCYFPAPSIRHAKLTPSSWQGRLSQAPPLCTQTITLQVETKPTEADNNVWSCLGKAEEKQVKNCSSLLGTIIALKQASSTAQVRYWRLREPGGALRRLSPHFCCNQEPGLQEGLTTVTA